ncbi:hypothetical protein [Nitrosomonas ureae]|uniref:hypothetical protein n=1 Tax=Nitrosomonas ureae TaxID=44577 RepID=UPI0015E1F52F|nr:hypothetical protein [Nitrosomonas ureae]
MLQLTVEIVLLSTPGKTKLKQGCPYSSGSSPGTPQLVGIPGWDTYHPTILKKD